MIETYKNTIVNMDCLDFMKQLPDKIRYCESDSAIPCGECPSCIRHEVGLYEMQLTRKKQSDAKSN